MAGTVIITGGNGSLGLGFVEAILASHAEYTLIATVRNTSCEEDANTAKLAKLASKHPNARVMIERLDLSSLASVRSFADSISTKISQGEIPTISALVCNAFTWSLDGGQKMTSDGYEATFQVSHLSHMLLVLKLLGSMDAPSGRIVMLGSDAHDPDKENPMSKLRAGFPVNDMEQLVHPLPDEPGQVHDRGFQRYANAKLANAVFMQDLNARLLADPSLAGITVTCMDPGGLVDSRAHAEQRALARRVINIANAMMPLLRHLTSVMRTTTSAGRDLVALSVGVQFKGKRGHFLGRQEGTPAKVICDLTVQKKLWAACWEWVALVQGETVLEKATPVQVNEGDV
ncbi:NAD(P)-binding protein [Parathielavia hyrcaniae]|uniref:3beta-hydroxysteroid 3-dehydrogenase n=1 Tax=Parathielavia hyrcaniae TaxID=113614 RepID=A0AAN6PSR7_9PEZI|nr:NAD(P)-binding protein [Parathielavia hyrcaniae]